MDALNTIVISLNVILAMYILVASLTYFFTVKSRWRWIKLCYALNAAILIVLYGNSVFHWFPLEIVFQRMVHTIMLSTLAAGILVSQAKLSYAHYLQRVAIVQTNRFLETSSAVAYSEEANGDPK